MDYNKLIYVTLFVVVVALVLSGVFTYQLMKPKRTRAYNFKEFPHVFGEDQEIKIVIRDNPISEDKEVAGDLVVFFNKHGYEARIIRYKQLGGLYDNEVIFLGTCDMVPKAEFLNLFADCSSLYPNTGVTWIIRANNHTLMSIAGYYPKDTLEMGVVLTNYKEYKLKETNTKFYVFGEMGNLTIRRID